MHNFVPGQRCISNAELQMGLGTVLKTEGRTVTVIYLSTGDTRTYAIQTAPLTRVEFSVGDVVQNHEGQSMRVEAVTDEEGLLFYSGKDTAGEPMVISEGQLDNHLQLNKASERLFNGQIDSDKWFELRYQTFQHINTLAHSDLYGLAGCRTSLIPHQLYIAHEVANRYAPRVLLADEVGLGKTIEAGLILHHQLLTERAQRVLIVVPETLMHQWLVEMLRRFNLYFRIFDEERCEALLANAETENIFHTEQLVLCSLEFLHRNPGHFKQSVNGDWDLLVVDEAHHLHWSPTDVSDEYAMVEELAKNTTGVLLLTATPEQLGKESHFARLRLLDPDRFPDFERFIEEENSYQPIAQIVEDLLNNKELTKNNHSIIQQTLKEDDIPSLLDGLSSNEDAEQSRIDLIEHLLDRHGTGRVLFRNTRAAVKGFPDRKVYSYPLAFPGLYKECLIEEEKKNIDTDQLLQYELTPELLDISKDWIGVDPRIKWLSDLLSTLYPKKVLVIAANASTAIELSLHLRTKAGIHAGVFHEGLNIVERDKAAAFFADQETGAQVLVCSEIGSEGRNFQFAHHIVLFDLPLNPDLLEQRIGRLDRIGQTETISIHVPYLKNSAQETLYHWYHEGLSAFEHTCPAGQTVYVQVEELLKQCLYHPDKKYAALIEVTSKLHAEFTEAMLRGRDKLLEYNSCRTQIAESLKEKALRADEESTLYEYMDVVFDCYGVNVELHSKNCFVIEPTDNMINKFPGLPDDGMTITYSRDTALSFEDAHYITWEHPFVIGAMDLVQNNEMGNTAVNTIKYKGVNAGSILLECIFMLEAAPVENLQVERYLPPTTIRIVIDEKGTSHHQKLSHDIINQARGFVDNGTAIKIVRAKQKILKTLVTKCKQQAQQQVDGILKKARQQSSDTLFREINRLKALQRINTNVRDVEITFFESELEMLTQILDSASLRLDALRVSVAT